MGKEEEKRGGEMAQSLRTLAAFAKDPGSISSCIKASHNHLTPVPGDPGASSAGKTPKHTK